jgi:hypothetical protein
VAAARGTGDGGRARVAARVWFGVKLMWGRHGAGASDLI